QAAYDAAAGKQVYFPAGTYHVNMVLLVQGLTRAGYVFDGGGAGYQAVGSILESGSSITTTGAGPGKTIIARDWAWMSSAKGVIWNVAPAIWRGYVGPQGSAGGASTFVSYPIDDASHGASAIVTTAAADAGKFKAGDIVFITG